MQLSQPALGSVSRVLSRTSSILWRSELTSPASCQLRSCSLQVSSHWERFVVLGSQDRICMSCQMPSDTGSDPRDMQNTYQSTWPWLFVENRDRVKESLQILGNFSSKMIAIPCQICVSMYDVSWYVCAPLIANKYYSSLCEVSSLYGTSVNSKCGQNRPDIIAGILPSFRLCSDHHCHHSRLHIAFRASPKPFPPSPSN